VVASAELLDIHREVVARCLPQLPREPFAHSEPGHWTPHVTLGRRFTTEQVALALEVLDGLSADIGAQVVGLRRWDSDAKRDYRIA